MGLDIVEIVMRTEEVFGVTLPDAECGDIKTVGDLYKLVLQKLSLPYVASKAVEASGNGKVHLRVKNPLQRSWTTDDVWLTLQALIQDQLQVGIDEMQEEAAFLTDLGCD